MEVRGEIVRLELGGAVGVCPGGAGAPPGGSHPMEVRGEIVRLELAETFVISRESQDRADVVHVTLTHDGVVGRGEGAPIERYEETASSALAFVERHSDLVGDDPFALEEI